VRPQTIKVFLQQVCRIKSAIGPESLGQLFPTCSRQPPTIGKQIEAVAFDELSLLSVHARILASPFGVHGFGHLGDNVELVEDDIGCGAKLLECGSILPPHNHDAEFDPLVLVFHGPYEKALETLQTAIFHAYPDRTSCVQIAYHDASSPFPKPDLVHADSGRPHIRRVPLFAEKYAFSKARAIL